MATPERTLQAHVRIGKHFEMLRPHWLPSIHQVSGRGKDSLVKWLAQSEFQLYNDLDSTGGKLSFRVAHPLVAAFGQEAARFTVAAVESAYAIEPTAALPKSIAWSIVRAYYAAFFAGHAILRVFGRACVRLNTDSLRYIHDIADVFGARNDITLKRGFYQFTIDSSASHVHLYRSNAVDGGSHAVMWRMLVELIRRLIDLILEGKAPKPLAQQVANKLIQVERSLTDHGGDGAGGWLSKVRNSVNYQMGFGAWFPYSEREKYYNLLFSSPRDWWADPMDIGILEQKKDDLRRFLETCHILVSLCTNFANEMAVRCTAGKSAHFFNVLALRRQIGI